MSALTLPRSAYTLPPPAFAAILSQCQAFSRDYMSRFDSSHDYAHIQRVLSLATRLSAASPTPLDTNIVTLAALLHDVGDKKYADGAAADARPVETFLASIACPAGLAAAVQTVVSNVSYSHEARNAAAVAAVLATFPELAVVQDADRLDALGAVGIGRCFVFSGVKMPERGMRGSIEHFEEKLVRLEGMMKTQMGREMARERTRRIEEFWGWWKEEVGEMGEGNEVEL